MDNAFIVFISIFCSAHPSRFQELLKYLSNIRLGSQRFQGIGWKLYDEQYRLRKAYDPSSSWAIIDSDLWLLYMSKANTNDFQSQSSSTSRLNNLKCYTFNYQGQCYRLPCSFAHCCLFCNGGHPVILCRFKQKVVMQVMCSQDLHKRVVHNPIIKPGFNVTQSSNLSFRGQQQRFTRPRPPNEFVGSRQNSNYC